MGFVPAMYLQDCEIEEALRLRKKINAATTLRQIEMYEERMKNIIRMAYVRYKTKKV